ncbi:MAG: hypothetical protein ACLQEQ_04020 [Nitrososphaerales archaeon]
MLPRSEAPQLPDLLELLKQLRPWDLDGFLFLSLILAHVAPSPFLNVGYRSTNARSLGPFTGHPQIIVAEERAKTNFEDRLERLERQIQEYALKRGDQVS